jgi:hypothetical protein
MYLYTILFGVLGVIVYPMISEIYKVHQGAPPSFSLFEGLIFGVLVDIFRYLRQNNKRSE